MPGSKGGRSSGMPSSGRDKEVRWLLHSREGPRTWSICFTSDCVAVLMDSPLASLLDAYAPSTVLQTARLHGSSSETRRRKPKRQGLGDSGRRESNRRSLFGRTRVKELQLHSKYVPRQTLELDPGESTCPTWPVGVYYIWRCAS